MAALAKARWRTLPLMTFPVGCRCIGLVCALQVVGQLLGLLLSSHQDLNLVSIVLFMVERLGAPAVVAFLFMENPTFWKSSGPHRPREFGGSGRIRKFRPSMRLSINMENVHSKSHPLLIVGYTPNPADRRLPIARHSTDSNSF